VELLEVLSAEFGPVVAEGWEDADGVVGPSTVSDGDVTVAICTRERPEGLKRCLASLLAQDSKEFDVLVIDNAPASERTKEVASEFTDRLPIKYVREPLPGLSRARNRSIVEATRRIIAWVDDDEEVDHMWVRRVVRGFRDPMVACVCGVMLPAELETAAQVLFEQWGGHGKGRGFAAVDFWLRDLGQREVLYPLPGFGMGGNMAMRRDAILELGGFDEALGGGSPAMGSEDTLAFTELLLRGFGVRYDPSAITRHYHRADLEGLRRQLYGYGVAMSAFYTALVINHVKVVPELISLIPRAVGDFRSPFSVRNAGLDSSFPADIIKENRRGFLHGPTAYLKGRFALKRQFRPHRIAAGT
jgi:glycosyltransferase involved in cell wall biosynthesis